MDISEMEFDIRKINYLINCVTTNKKYFEKKQLLDILSSLRYDMNSRLRTSCFDDKEVKIMQELHKKIISEEFLDRQKEGEFFSIGRMSKIL